MKLQSYSAPSNIIYLPSLIMVYVPRCLPVVANAAVSQPRLHGLREAHYGSVRALQLTELAPVLIRASGESPGRTSEPGERHKVATLALELGEQFRVSRECVQVCMRHTHSFWLAAEEEVFDVKWVVNFSTILALALLNGRHSLLILGACG